MIVNRNNNTRAGVPPAIYITFIIIMLCAALLSLLTLRRIGDLRRTDGSVIGQHDKRAIMVELKENISVFREFKLLLMIPAFLPAGSFLIYLGSVNAFQNTLRARSLLSFIAIVVQIPFGHALQLILDNPKWPRRKRGLVGLAFVGIPLCGVWIWEIARAVNFNRNKPPQTPIDWNEPAFGSIMVLFVLNWTFSILWQYIVPWFIGALISSPAKLSHYMGVQVSYSDL